MPPGRAGYFLVMTKWPRRFCCQQPSVSSLQNGCSLPLLTTVMRVAGTPRLAAERLLAERHPA